jgi:putative hydrolase of the HAD superfamily
LFDFFGTLTRAVRRGSGHAEIARALGCEPAEYLRALDSTYYARASGSFGGPAEGLLRVATLAGANPTHPRIVWALQARIAVQRDEGRLRDEAVPLLAALRADGLRTAVVSDCWYELPITLPRLPVAPLLDTAVYSVEVGHCKPHPAMYLTACARLGVEPSRCVYVGDGGSCELSGARCVGMTAVQLAAPDHAAHMAYLPETDWYGPRVASLWEIRALLSTTDSCRLLTGAGTS